ncbi:hypothetical protein G6F23_015188 [Rhizopus arrhizus]|nr:hypothetical protein G6F23_015188 [Rhizopus arrhizus]
MKFVATPIVRHFGFRRVLTVNALLTGVFIMVCATFTPATPVWLMIAILLVGGFFRSLQFTGQLRGDGPAVGHQPGRGGGRSHAERQHGPARRRDACSQRCRRRLHRHRPDVHGLDLLL